ncbi:MAG TPA: hypothetical protein VMH04_03730 [Candidatus Solibacter sp.]|nr:hypothetical protein [Candidatus Solibacter sp.]
MFREFGAFLLLFSVLGAIVHQGEIVYILAAAAFIFLSVDLMSAKALKSWRATKPRSQHTL